MSVKAYWCSSLTGGGTGALDAIDGDDLNDGDMAIRVTSTRFDPYRLNATSGVTESSPDIIAPDLNAGLKRWERIHLVHSEPDSGDYAIRSFRREANGDLTYVYKETAES